MSEEKIVSNHAGFLPDDSIEEMTEKHNQNVSETIGRAKNGEVICLSDLLIDQEKILEKIIAEKEPDFGK